MTNKCRADGDDLMIEHNRKFITDASEVVSHMNDFEFYVYVNIARNIGADASSPDLEGLMPGEAVERSVIFYSEHFSMQAIESEMIKFW